MNIEGKIVPSKGYRLFLVGTRMDYHDGAGIEDPIPKKQGDLIHFVHTDMNDERGIRVTVISLDIFSGEFWGPYLCLTLPPSDPVGYDITNSIYWHGYLRKIKGIEGYIDNEIWNRYDSTTFIRSMPWEKWIVALELLNNVLKERIENRRKNPRNNRVEKLDDDYLDRAFARILKRVNATLLNGGLFWGKKYISFDYDLDITPWRKEIEEPILEG